jgi:carboxypeptidase C (cathepsin A)
MTSSYRLGIGLFAAALFLGQAGASAQEDTAAHSDTNARKFVARNEKPMEPPPPAADATTHGMIDAGGQHIAYTAIAGTITVGATDIDDAQLGSDGNPQPGSELALNAPKEPKDAPPTARMFYVAYVKTGAKPEERPVTFLYNGGPGSATVWLHMGSLGPKHVVTAGDTHLPAAPYTLIDNPNTLLDVSDLVFIDMPGTGFGRLLGKDPGKAFWGLDQDASAYTRFIARFLSKYGRWNSPKYLFGESYGTTRSAVLAADLQRRSIDLNGVMLLSQIFNFTDDIDFPPNDPISDLACELGLPTFAATAWYHKKLPQHPAALEPFLNEVEQFAIGPYAHALAEGTDVSAQEAQQVADKLQQYTGLPAAYWVKAGLRVDGGEFRKMLQDSDDVTTGRLDTRFSGPDLDPLSETGQYDPQSAAIGSAYLSLFNDYVRKVLKYGEGQTYLPSAPFNGAHWQWREANSEAGANVSGDLARAMKMNPRLKVMVNGGYFDLATPFFTAEYEDKHLPIPQSLAKNIQYDWYESGHMVYVRDESLKQLHDRAAAFITGSGKG